MPPTISSAGRQQRLTELTTVINAPGSVLSQPSGDVGESAIEGYYLDDRRVLSHILLTVNGSQPDHLATAHPNPQNVEFTALAPHLVTSDADFGLQGDPLVMVIRHRELGSAALAERIEMRSAAPHPVTIDIRLELGTDGSTVSVARTGASDNPRSPELQGATEIRWNLDDATVHAALSPAPATLEVNENSRAIAHWTIELPPRGSSTIALDVVATGELQQPTSAQSPQVSVQGSLPLERLFERSLADVYALVRSDAANPDDRFVCAGVPWYLTLFGRDSLWSARMLLAFDPDLALGTLRALARRQGHHDNPATAEQPGKILHELRRESVAQLLPAQYFGTADATSLWVILLVETWRWGVDPEKIRALLPQLHAALAWLEQQTLANNGFIEYTPDPSGLANQGWKDSRDAIHDRHGDHHDGAIALVEAQAYAHLAANEAANLLESFGEPDAEHWRSWATALRERFASRFWAEHDGERLPALAIVNQNTLADAVTSNLGHLLGTGIVSAEETEVIAQRLGQDDLDSGFGLRTLSSRSPRYNPVSYHNGSIWPHDTTIAIRGLAATGHGELAARLSQAILAAGEAFEYRLPELWSGMATVGSLHGTRARPLPYPTACSPQAWSSASIVSIIISALGIHADLPNRRVEFQPPRPLLLGGFTVRGIKVGSDEIDVKLTDSGMVEILRAPSWLTIVLPDG